MSVLRLLNLSSISHRCSKEQRVFLSRRPYDPRYCFELFRRALADSDQAAWTHVVEIFGPLVSSWVTRHSEYQNCGEAVEYFVQGAFVRVWTYLGGDNFDESRDLGELLKYLKRCVNSEIMEHLRRKRVPTVEMPNQLAGDSPFPVDPIAVDQLWSFVNGKLNGDQERIVVYASFFLDYKPREIYSAYSAYFKSVGEIHRIKQNVINRLRRVPGFQEYFETHL